MRGTTLLAAGVALLLAGVALATTLKRLTLDQVTEGSRSIVAGTVRATRSVPGIDTRTFVMTEVELEKLDVWHGTVSTSTLKLRFAGGTLDGDSLIVPGVPTFKSGERCVLFLDPDADELCPTVGWVQGCYRIARDERTGTESVQAADGHPVYGFDSGLPVLTPSKERPRPLSAVELKVEVVRALERAAERARAAAEEAEQPAAKDDEPRDQPPVPERKEDGR